MKIKINPSVEKQLGTILAPVKKQDIWYPLYGEQGEPIFSGRNKSHEFYSDLDRYVHFKGKTVIDLGCNLGHYSFLAARLGATKVLGLDINENLIQACNILRDHLGLYQVVFKTSDFLNTKPDDHYDIVLLIDYIGKNVINKLKLKQVLTAVENYSRKEILFTFYHAYKLSGKLKTAEEKLIPHYAPHFIRDGKFMLLEYVQNYFSGKGILTVFKPEISNRFYLKRPVHFIQTGGNHQQRLIHDK